MANLGVFKSSNMPMAGVTDHWRKLCIAAAFEDNPEQLQKLVREIDDCLLERQEELTDKVFEKLANVGTVEKRWIQ